MVKPSGRAPLSCLWLRLPSAVRWLWCTGSEQDLKNAVNDALVFE
jgi:hypothetical protein